ncbi:hypothetical protein ACLBX9_07110 [Methylobacterium sp. A49B]
MPHSARFAPFSLNATWPHATSPEIVGRRRMDPLDQCEGCMRHAVVKGPSPGGEIVSLDLCWHYMG